MTQSEKGKNIFQAAIDSVSNRDEKAAIEAAMKHSQELEQRIAQMEQSAAQTTQKLAEAEQRATQTAQKLAESERKVTQLTADLAKTQSELTATRTELSSAKNLVAATNVQLNNLTSAEKARQDAASAQAAAKAQVMTEHTIKADETLSHISLKYYGSAYEPYWRVIYEANKDVIGSNPNHVRPGTVLKIPVLPEELKKK